MTVFASILWAFTLILLIYALCCWKRFTLAASLTKTASEFLSSKPSILFGVPFVTFLAFTAFLTYWIVSAVYVFSVGDVATYSSSYYK